jgi:hypothetical protein
MAEYDTTEEGRTMNEAESKPEILEDVPPDRTHDLDVREKLRRGGEPFEEIMAAAGAVSGDGVLRVRAIFEPHPLYSVMASRGFEHWTEKLGEEDWRVWFWRAGEDEG